MNPFFTKWNSVKTKENGVTNSDLIPQKGLLKQTIYFLFTESEYDYPAAQYAY